MNVFLSKIKPIFINLILIVSVLGLVIMCIEENINQEPTFSNLTLKFYKSIMKSNPNKFDFQYNKLSPQESYFSDCELKFLILKNKNDLSNIEQLIEFNNDSIIRITTRKTSYRGKVNSNEKINWYKIKSDSVFVLDFENKKKEIFKKKKLIKTINMNFDDENINYIYRVKSKTEKEYNCR